MSLTLDVWFDYLCPFSVMTSKVLDDTGLARDLPVRWRPYELHPGGIPAGGKKDYPQGVWENSVVPMAERLGVALGRTAPSGPLPRTELAMHGHEFARRQGVGPAYDARVFAAYFQEHRDIADPATLAEIAGQLGLDAGEFRRWVGSVEAAERHQVGQDEARLVHRIHTVPTVVVGSWRTEGVPSPARLLEVCHELTSVRRGAPATA